MAKESSLFVQQIASALSPTSNRPPSFKELAATKDSSFNENGKYRGLFSDMRSQLHVFLRPMRHKFSSLTIILTILLLLTIYHILPLRLSQNGIWLQSTLYNQTAPPIPSANFQINSKVAVIIESRPLSNLVPLILHFSEVLGPEWPIIFYTPLSQDIFHSSPIFERRVQSGGVQIRPLPEGVNVDTDAARSAFLKKAWVWEELAPAEHVLLFDAESVICKKSEKKVEDFLKWDFIGAPIKKSWGQGFNGGLSLRKRKLVLDVINDKNPYPLLKTKESKSPVTKFQDRITIIGRNNNDHDAKSEIPDWLSTHSDPEEVWLYKKLINLPSKADGSPGANIPSEKDASYFAVETVYYEKPLGYHHPGEVFSGDDYMKQLNEYCPEWTLAYDEWSP